MMALALNIKDPETVRLASEVAALTGETKTRAVKVALEERKRRLAKRRRGDEMRRFFEEEIWPHVPPEELDRPPMTKAEREEILGIGPEGV